MEKLATINTDRNIYVILALVLIFLLIFVSKFQHIPGPIYGGDLYMIRGFTQAILQGYPPWQDPYFAGHYAYYGWLGYLITALLVRLTGIGLERMSVLLPALLEVCLLYVAYKFGTTLFKSKRYGLIFLFVMFSATIIQTKISGMFAWIFMLLTLWFWLRFEQGEKRAKYWAGVFMGLTALSHIISFIALCGMIGLTIFIEFVRHSKKSSLKKNLGVVLRKYLAMFAIGVAIAMLLVAPWVFVYKMHTLNQTQQYSMQDINKDGLPWVIRSVWGVFIRISGVIPFIWGVIIFLGLIFCVLNRRKLEQRIALYWLIAAILFAGHFLITRPLLNNWIVPIHIWGGTIWIVELVLFTYGIKNLELMFSHMKIDSNVVLAVFFVFILIVSYQRYTAINNDQWINYGRTMDDNLRVLFETENWILEKTDTDDVFLANDESAFALNALSGRHVVAVRRTHANYYVDVDKRYADAMVMLYGNSKEKTVELLEEYSVDYVYIDGVFLLSRPMITTLDYADYLEEYGVNYTVKEVRFDPSTPSAPTYEGIEVMPQQLRILEYNITNLVKRFDVGNDFYSAFFEVVI